MTRTNGKVESTMANQKRNEMDSILAESFKELARKEPIEKITIKEITDRAGVIRPTFYNHFQDKYELLEWIVMTQIIAPIEPLMQNGMVYESLVLMFTSVEQDKEFYSRACRLEGQNSFESIVRSCVRKVILSVVQKRSSGRKLPHAWLTPDNLADYYSQSMCFVAIHWIKGGMPISAREVADIYQYVIKRSLEDILNEM